MAVDPGPLKTRVTDRSDLLAIGRVLRLGGFFGLDLRVQPPWRTPQGSPSSSWPVASQLQCASISKEPRSLLIITAPDLLHELLQLVKCCPVLWLRVESSVWERCFRGAMLAITSQLHPLTRTLSLHFPSNFGVDDEGSFACAFAEAIRLSNIHSLDLWFGGRGDSNDRFPSSVAIECGKMLPSQHSLRFLCVRGQLPDEAISALVRGLSRNTSIASFALRMDFAWLTAAALSEALFFNSTLRRLELGDAKVRHANFCSAAAVLTGLCRGLRLNTGLRALTVLTKSAPDEETWDLVAASLFPNWYLLTIEMEQCRYGGRRARPINPAPLPLGLAIASRNRGAWQFRAALCAVARLQLWNAGDLRSAWLRNQLLSFYLPCDLIAVSIE